MLEKHHQDHMENREQEDREHEQMVADMTVIRVKRRAEKEDKQVADIHGEGQRRQPAEIIYLMFISDLENLLSDWENVLSDAIMH